MTNTDMNHNKQILVTGAGGFLGYHTANYFSALGHQVEGMDIHFPDQPVDGQEPLFTVIEQDFRNWEETETALAGKDIVFHLASAHLQISLDESEYWDDLGYSRHSYYDEGSSYQYRL